MTKKIKIVFENPETRNRDSIVLDDFKDLSQQDGFTMTEFGAWRAKYDAAKPDQMIKLPSFGEITKRSVKGFSELRPEAVDENEKMLTRMQTDPPKNSEWRAICEAVEMGFRDKEDCVATPMIFKAICMSLWNLNNQRTQKAIKKGLEIMQEKGIEVDDSTSPKAKSAQDQSLKF